MDLESTQPYCMIPTVIHQIQNLQTAVSPPVYLEFVGAQSTTDKGFSFKYFDFLYLVSFH